MSWKGRVSWIALAVTGSVGGFEMVGPPWIFAVLAGFVAAAWWFGERFWTTVVASLLGGAIAGLLILGPGMRLAMRVVALVDPTIEPEFTIDGTLFLVLGIGGMLGAVQALTGNLYRHGFGIRSSVLGGLIPGGLFMVGLIFFFGELSEELFELGAGAWMNIPLFGIFVISWGIAAISLADRFSRGFRSLRGRVANEPVTMEGAERVSV